MTRKLTPVRVACAGVALLGPGGPAVRSQQAEPPEESRARPVDAKRSAWLHEVYLREASEYRFYLDDRKREPLELRREPVMRWTSEGDYNGEVYVWTDRGAAAVVGCIFSGPQGDGGRSVMHEFHSLASRPLAAGKGGGSGWQPAEPGITPEPIPDAPGPAGTRVLRLAQMRELARRFSAQVDREGGMSEMRLLPQPIYRDEVDGTGPLVDGAVFAFVWTAGTDPEVLLVIEARRAGGGPRWEFAPARFTNREARVRYRGKEVWRAEPAAVGIFDGVTTRRYGAFAVKSVPAPGGSP